MNLLIEKQKRISNDTQTIFYLRLKNKSDFQHLHRMGIVLRDLSIEGVLVSPDGGAVKVDAFLHVAARPPDSVHPCNISLVYDLKFVVVSSL